MAKRINIGDIGNYSKENLDRLMRVVVLETDAELKSQSPVDTGRFRASWIIGENSSESSYDAGPGRRNTPPTALNYTAGREEFGQNYHIHNTLPYADPLARGHSKQAPAGWIDIIARQMTNRARQLADQIGRSD
jgi:hypothetical protein